MSEHRSVQMLFGFVAAAVAAETAPLPVPPMPPARPPLSDLAPTPNDDAIAPSGRNEGRGVAIAPEFFSAPQRYLGDGYARGSTIQPVQERQLRPTPGVKLSVPLN